MGLALPNKSSEANGLQLAQNTQLLLGLARGAPFPAQALADESLCPQSDPELKLHALEDPDLEHLWQPIEELG